MAYRAKRFKKVIEEFELVDENGRVVECLHVELDAGSMVEKIRQKYVNLIRAQGCATKIKASIYDKQQISEAYMTLGVAVSDLIEAVFGQEDTEKILKFYENNYVELSQEVIPFISQVVLPKVNEIAKQNKQEVLSKYNRKIRRGFLRKGLF